MQSETPRRRRWPRSQRFALTAAGVDAESAYRATIVASRVKEGRASFDEARTAWTARFGVQPDDGLYLGEMSGGSKTRVELVTALETCGKTPDDALAAIERLWKAGLIIES